MEMCDPFGWHRIEIGKLDEIRRKLAEFEALTSERNFSRSTAFKSLYIDRQVVT
jgi:hypothetical protein